VLTTVAGRAAAIARAGVPDHVYVAVRPRIERLLGLQERELSYLLQAKSPGRRRFVDVGANWGSYTVLLAPSFAHTDAFEPIIRCAASLEKYAALRGGRIHVHPCALSDVNDTLALLVPEDGVVDASGRSRIVETGDSSTVDISARTLDSFGFDDVDLVKIDVEGHERSVIAGARETLLRCKPTLVVEIEQRHIVEPLMDRIAFVEALGYQASFVRGGCLVPLDKFDLERDQNVANVGKGDLYVNNFLFEPCSGL
jgi:FkbM family methyltransferase